MVILIIVFFHIYLMMYWPAMADSDYIENLIKEYNNKITLM